MKAFVFSLFSVFLALSGAGHAAEPVNEAALLNPRPARHLSDYHLFINGAAQLPNVGVMPYDLATPLFTDYAHKFRFVYIPKGQKASYDDTEVLHFPVGTVLMKTFAYPADFRRPDKNVRLIETRLLIHQKKGWNAWAYIWNADMSDATLSVAGATLPVAWRDTSGHPRGTNYVVPNKNQCKGCHSFDRAFTPIGPKARNLNHVFAYKAGAENQIQHWVKAGKLTGVPAHVPSVPRWDDASADLASRARAYLDVNCAHCHRLEGPGSTSGLFLTWGTTNKTHRGIMKRPVAAGRGAGGLDFDIVPGHADQSIMIFRLSSNDPGIMMPEAGRTMVHQEGVAMLKEWINSMK
ncbi:SO2930 family diheme c-type cytochrome [Kordiimonas marina]|uniref:SO2930 family diheme c-type cytochrome n=1 Tax=Kordiimonas marina TaxID=2872312 RepID=UPI001FF506AC